MRLFLREKDEKLEKAWPKKRLRELIIDKLKQAGQDASFISKQNLLLLQQSFGPLFREVDKEHPRMSQTAKEIIPVDIASMPKQSFSESMLKEHGAVWYVQEEQPPYGGHEVHPWEQYQRFLKQFKEYGDDASEKTKAPGIRLRQVDIQRYKIPYNVLYTSHDPERQFTELLFANADLFDAFVKMPNQGGYSFPYSYKPAKTGKKHTANENFNPCYFIRMRGLHDILVVEVKAEGDDSNRNRAKCRDGLKHFETLNGRLADLGEPWRYHFYFLSPDDYTSFFTNMRDKTYEWTSGLMQQLA